MPDPIHVNSANVDLSGRFFRTATVGASPAAGSITTVTTLTLTADLIQALGIQLWCWVALTIGTSGVSYKLDIRQTNTTGAVVATTGALTASATNLVSNSCMGLDTAGTLPGQVYVACLTIASGAATSTVSAVNLSALVV